MRIHSRSTILGLAVGLLGFTAAPALSQQPGNPAGRDTGMVPRQQDTTGRAAQPAQPGADTMAQAMPAPTDTGAAAATDTTRAGKKAGQVSKKGKKGYRYTGAASDTALRAKPGVHTGRNPSDTSRTRDTMRMRDTSGYDQP